MKNKTVGLSEAAQILDLHPNTIKRLIDKKELAAEKVAGCWKMNREDVYGLRVLRSYDSNVETFTPETSPILKGYAFYHDALDIISFLLNITYLSREELKSKLYRSDVILQRYIEKLENNIKHIKKESFKKNKKQIIKSLKQAWYYELYFNSPARNSPLDTSSSALREDWGIIQDRMVFIAPKIIMGYYAIYYYMRVIVLLFSEVKINEQHSSLLNILKHSVWGKINNKVLFYPLNILTTKKAHTIRNNKTIFPVKKYPDYFKYNYSQWKRGGGYCYITEAEKAILQTLHSAGLKEKKYTTKNEPFNIFDLLYDFRVWANYIDIDTLLVLKSEGYRTYLDASMSKIMFILGGICEYLVINILGSKSYSNTISDYHYSFLTTNSILFKRGINNPVLQRNIIFHNIKIISSLNPEIFKSKFNRIYPIISKNNKYRYPNQDTSYIEKDDVFSLQKEKKEKS